MAIKNPPHRPRRANRLGIKEGVGISITREKLALVQRIQRKYGFRKRSDAFNHLIDLGLQAEENGTVSDAAYLWYQYQ